MGSQKSRHIPTEQSIQQCRTQAKKLFGLEIWILNYSLKSHLKLQFMLIRVLYIWYRLIHIIQDRDLVESILLKFKYKNTGNMTADFLTNPLFTENHMISSEQKLEFI